MIHAAKIVFFHLYEIFSFLFPIPLTCPKKLHPTFADLRRQVLTSEFNLKNCTSNMQKIVI